MQPLNSPIEIGLRVVVLLDACFPVFLSLEDLMYLDHALVHSGDLGGPESIHPDTPLRAAEIAPKRHLLMLGIDVMARARLLDGDYGTLGLRYKASEDARPFLATMNCAYLNRLTLSAEWVSSTLVPLSVEERRGRLEQLVSTAYRIEEVRPT